MPSNIIKILFISVSIILDEKPCCVDHCDWSDQKKVYEKNFWTRKKFGEIWFKPDPFSGVSSTVKNDCFTPRPDFHGIQISIFEGFSVRNNFN